MGSRRGLPRGWRNRRDSINDRGGSLFGSECPARCWKSRGAPLAVIHLGGMNGGEVRVCASLSSAGTPGRHTARVI